MNLRTPFAAVPMFEPTRAPAHEGHCGSFHGAQGTAMPDVNSNALSAIIAPDAPAIAEVESVLQPT